MRNTFITSLCVILAIPALAAERTNEVYKWKDADGNLYYGDSIPPEFAERPKEKLNDQGVAVEHLEGKKTPEQLEQERIDNERRVAEALQQRQDTALLNTYLSVEEIVMHRDRRIELFQAQARVTEMYLRNLERRMQNLRSDASRYRPYSDDQNAPMIDEDLAADLRETRATISRHEQNLAKYQADERVIIERFNTDIERFKVLKGLDEPEKTASAGS